MPRPGEAMGRQIRWVWDHPGRSAGVALGIVLLALLEGILIAVGVFIVSFAQLASYWGRYGDNTNSPPLRLTLENPVVGAIFNILSFQVEVLAYVGTLGALPLFLLWLTRRVVVMLHSSDS